MGDNSWTEKHRPETWSEIQGNNKSVKQIKNWIENWEIGDKPQLLHGEPGTGKTTTAYVAAKKMDVPLNKVNLSDKRRGAELKQVAKSTMTSPPDHDYQLVLLDEIDNMYHSVNKKPLYDALRTPRNPIIVTANDKYEVPDAVKRACNTHKYKLGVRSRKAKIKQIAADEGVDLQPSELNRLGSRPDLRSAINDLQNASGDGSTVGKDNRTWEIGEFDAIEALLKGESKVWRDSIGYQDDTFDRIDSALLWADDNLTEQFRGLEAGIAYQMLATADFWAGRAWERQNFRYQKYGWALLEALPDARLSDPYTGYMNANLFPSWFRASEAKHDGESPEAQLYQALKGGDRGYQMACSFYEFKQRHLQILRSQPEEERLQLALNHGMSEKAVEALGLEPSDFEDWREVESPEEGDGWTPDTQSAADADW